MVDGPQVHRKAYNKGSLFENNFLVIFSEHSGSTWVLVDDKTNTEVRGEYEWESLDVAGLLAQSRTFQSPVYTVGPFPSSISRRPQTPRHTLSHGWAGSRGGGGDTLRWWWCLHAPRLLTSHLALPPDQNECIIANPAFVVYSSIVSFYVPFIVTLLVYIKIYIVLRRRRKRVNTKRSSRAFRANLKAPLKVPRSLLPSSALLDPPRTERAGLCWVGLVGG